MKKVIVIVGPTGSGKTKRSVELAKKYHAEIINGDSVQIYKELNIGSAKITEAEKKGILHHLFDVRNLGEPYTAFNFQKDVRSLIAEIDLPIIVGGTGFYIKSALYDYEFNQEENEQNQFEELTNAEIYQKLIKLDPKIEIDKFNRVRLIRALNLALSGNLRSSKNNKDQKLYDVLTIYLDYDRVELKNVLEKRLDIMFEQGFLEEVKDLKNQGHELNIIGYRELLEYLDGLISLDEAKEKIVWVSMKLAKKQKTWFKNQMEGVIFNALDNDIDSLINQKVKEFIEE